MKLYSLLIVLPRELSFRKASNRRLIRKLFQLTLILVLGISCNTTIRNSGIVSPVIDTLQGVSLLGKKLIAESLNPETDSARISAYIQAEKNCLENPGDAMALIWKGRRMAYLGDYKKAIDIFTEGIDKFPDDARMYRHRGHRYISLRQFDKAISDLEKAVELIDGTEDMTEPDGIANARNQPVSTTHRNIWYHLGLAYYLVDDMENALRGFKECLAISDNPDMKVASSHWVYMILRRLGREDEASAILEPVSADMDVYENMSYHSLLLFYKGELSESDLIGETGEISTAGNAVLYGLGNWYYYNGDAEKAEEIFNFLVDKGIWAAFGTIAAEADLARMKSSH